MAGASSAPEGYKMKKKWSPVHFAIGVFGACAIIGVLAKIFKFEMDIMGTTIGWEPLVLVGFLGEATVFIIMGMLREFTYVKVDEDELPEDGEGAYPDSSRGEAQEALSSSYEELDAAVYQVSKEADRLSQQMRQTTETLVSQNKLYEDLTGLRAQISEITLELGDAVENLTGELNHMTDVVEEGRNFSEELQSVRNRLSNLSEEVVDGVSQLDENITDLNGAKTDGITLANRLQDLQESLLDQADILETELGDTNDALKSMQQQFSHTAHRFERFNDMGSMANNNKQNETVSN